MKRQLLGRINGLQRYLTSHILLYHSTYSNVPSHLSSKLHNVAPDQLYKQLLWFKRYFDVVDVDSFFEHREPGKVAITFDDAYESVFSEALSVVRSVGIPCTVFLNGVTLQGKPFWRDKVRFLINASLVEEFLTWSKQIGKSSLPAIAVSEFYKASKHPATNSALLDAQLDSFIESKGIDPQIMTFCVKDRSLLLKNKDVTYGNHTYNHYVLSSLMPEQQEAEIGDNHRLLHSLGLRVSKVFSIPFGGRHHFNSHTLEIVKKHGYVGCLFSRNRLNHVLRRRDQDLEQNLSAADRYMVDGSFDGFQKQIFRMAVKSTVRGVIDLFPNRSRNQVEKSLRHQGKT